MIRCEVWAALLLLWATVAGAVPYTAPTITGRSIPSCLGVGNPIPCCTTAGFGNCILDTDFTGHTSALQRVDALLRSDITQPANYVLAGPTSGGSATPTWRALVSADVPAPGTLNLETATLTNILNNEMLLGTAANTGTYVLLPAGGTNGCAGATTDKVLYNSSTHAWSCGADQTGAGGGVTSLTCGAGLTCTSTNPITATGTMTVGSDAITPNMLKTAGQTDELCLTYEATGTTLEWQACGSGGITGTGTDNRLMRWSGTTGAQDSLATLDDFGALTLPGDITASRSVASPGSVLFMAQNTGSGTASLGAQSATGAAQTQWTGNSFLWTAGVPATNSWALSRGNVLGTNNVLACDSIGGCTFPDTDGVTVTGPLTTSDNLVLSGTASKGINGGGLVDCSNTTTSKLLWTASSNKFSCGTDQGGGGGMTGFTLSADGGADQPINNADVLEVASGNGLVTTTGATDIVTVALRGGQVASPTVCLGTSDASVTVEAEISQATSLGKAYLLPSGCVIGLGSPGAGNAAIDLPNGASILCQDQTAGFRAQRQRCTGGVYAGAACNTDAECVPLGGGGSGTCDNDFGTTSANPCTGTECFAPTAGSVYTMLKDAAVSANITIANCSFWTTQADPYQRCVGGTAAGDPCRQECSNADSFPGRRCNVDADCGGTAGSCLRRADCGAGGGTCDGVPKSAVGAGKINVLDLARTTGAQIRNVRVNDHFVGDFGVSVDANAQVTDTNLAAEATNCQSPFASPTNSLCYGIVAGSCCYGASTLLGVGANTQPTTAVTNGLVFDTSSGGDASIAARVQTRGSAQALLASSSAAVRAQQMTVLPLDGNGPGTAGGGIKLVGGTVTDAIIKYLAANATGIQLTGSGTIANNSVAGLTGTGAVGIFVAGDDVSVIDNGIDLGAGVGIESNGARTIISNNRLTGTTGTGIKLSASGAGKSGQRIIGNTSVLTPGVFITPTILPRHIALEGTTNTQVTIGGNFFQGGWRGVDAGTTTVGGGLTNTNIANNRFHIVTGAAVALGGAGVQVIGNYINGVGGLSPSSVCDPVCTTTPGRPCTVDSDCGTCTGVTNKCVPEPVIWIGYPNLNTGSTHQGILNNIIYAGNTAPTAITGQCAGGTTVGQLCSVVTCAAGSTCTAGTGGAPAKCVGTGTDADKRCCLGAATCTPRQSWSVIRATDGLHNETVIAGNKIFGPQPASIRGIDFAAGTSGNPDFSGLQISGNDIYFGANPTTGVWGITMPSGTPTITNAQIDGNHFWNLNAELLNWKGSYGRASFPSATIAVATDQTVTSALLSDVTALTMPVEAGRFYKIFCHLQYTTSAATEGIALAVNGPAIGAGRIGGRIGICDSTADCLTAGTANYLERHVNAYDTELLSIAVQGTIVRGAVLEFILVNGATAGNVVVRARAETGGANSITIKSGSYCDMNQVPGGS